MDTLLIVGIDTMLGANLALSLDEQFDVCGISLGSRGAPAGCKVRATGEVNAARLRPLIQEMRPRWMIHAGPLARSSWDGGSQHVIWQQEVALATGIGAIAKEAGIAHCFLSTDAVFAGPRLFHEESARATAPSALAVAAREAESTLVASGALVVRTHAYGWGAAQDGSFLDTLWQRLAANEQPSCDGRHYVTPILASDLAPLLARAYELKLHGLYHITGAERTNRIRFANELAAAGGYEAGYRSPMPHSEMNTGPALETSLNTRRARRDLQLPMPLLREGLERLVAQRVNGYLDRLQPATKSQASHAA